MPHFTLKEGSVSKFRPKTSIPNNPPQNPNTPQHARWPPRVGQAARRFACGLFEGGGGRWEGELGGGGLFSFLLVWGASGLGEFGVRGLGLQGFK